MRLIRNVVNAGHKEGIWVGLCGEMAGDPVIAVVLLGLGVDELSMGAVAIPEVKRAIRSIRLSDAKRLLEEILTRDTSDEIKKLAYERVGRLIRRPAPRV